MIDAKLKFTKLRQSKYTCSGCNKLVDRTEILNYASNPDLGPLVIHTQEEVYHIRNQRRSL